MREAKAGRFSAQRAIDEFQKRWAAATDGRQNDFERAVRDAILRADAQSVEELRARAGGFTSVETYRNVRDGIENWAPVIDGPASWYKVFRVMGPTEWAKSVPDPEFLIEKVLCRDTSGVNAGPKKSLKTHDNQAIALAVATGMNLYRSEHFPVRHQGKVLYVVGEGGEIPTRRTLRRMVRAYELDLNVVAQDPAFPLIAAFGAAPLDSPQFCDDLKLMLDEHQPDLVLIESFYNFHPAKVNAANLFERGPVIDAYHKLVVSECEGATSMMTDHFRSTNRSKSFDLDSISMAGQAENADSWILRDHREKPNVSEGEFWLKVVFASRQWGDGEWEIDWHLGPFDHDLGHHVGEITWDARPAMAATAESPDSKTAERICQVVMDNPFELTETSVLDKVGGKREKAYEVLQGLKVNGWVVVKNRERKEGARTVKRDLVGPGGLGNPFRGGNGLGTG